MRGLVPMTIAVTALIALCIWGTVPIFAVLGAFWTAAYIVLLLAGWFVLEIATGVMLFTYGRFVPVIRNRPDKRSKEIL